MDAKSLGDVLQSTHEDESPLEHLKTVYIRHMANATVMFDEMWEIAEGVVGKEEEKWDSI